MLAAACVARARVYLLPPSHPAFRMMSAADDSGAYTWSSVVRQRMADLGDCCPKDVVIWAEERPELIAQARACRVARKDLLRQYRQLEVLPPLQEYDMRAFRRAAEKDLSALGCSVGDLLPVPTKVPLDLLADCTSFQFWRWFRLWAVTKLTGAWPFAVFGHEAKNERMQRCPACGARDVCVPHALALCPATEALYMELKHEALSFPVKRDRTVARDLLRAPMEHPEFASIVKYCGAALPVCMGPILNAGDADLGFDEQVKQDVDTWLRTFQ